MTLSQQIALGTVVPHRSPDPIDASQVGVIARKAETLGFQDVWVTDNTLDYSYSLDAFVTLSFAAAATTTLRFGTAVLVLPLRSPIHVAHSCATLDQISGGRLTLGVGLGRDSHYHEFQMPTERRVRRLREGIELMRALWSEPKVDYEGQIYHVSGATMKVKPVQQPGVPVWIGGTHPDAIRRAGAIADGWMGSGNMSNQGFAEGVPLLKQSLEAHGRNPATFPVSKRVFMYVDEKPGAARVQVERWFAEAYRNAALTDRSGVFGTAREVEEQLLQLVEAGANHLLLNTVANYDEQLDALAEVGGLGAKAR